MGSIGLYILIVDDNAYSIYIIIRNMQNLIPPFNSAILEYLQRTRILGYLIR